MKGKFKKEFVKSLKEKIPSKILDLDLKFPEKQNGFIRLENFKLTAVYLSRLSSNTPDANGDGVFTVRTGANAGGKSGQTIIDITGVNSGARKEFTLTVSASGAAA